MQVSLSARWLSCWKRFIVPDTLRTLLISHRECAEMNGIVHGESYKVTSGVMSSTIAVSSLCGRCCSQHLRCCLCEFLVVLQCGIQWQIAKDLVHSK